MKKTDLITFYSGMALQGLMANPERYHDIRKQIEAGELTQEQATRKNTNKAKRMAEDLADLMEEAGHCDE